MSLRSQCIEAGAQGIFYSGERTKNHVWNSLSNEQRRFYLQMSRDAFDAALGVLSEHALEWGRTARRISDDPETFLIVPEDIADLLAVLGERNEK